MLPPLDWFACPEGTEELELDVEDVTTKVWLKLDVEVEMVSVVFEKSLIYAISKYALL